jgi:hypothetical protein
VPFPGLIRFGFRTTGKEKIGLMREAGEMRMHYFEVHNVSPLAMLFLQYIFEYN